MYCSEFSSPTKSSSLAVSARARQWEYQTHPRHWVPYILGHPPQKPHQTLSFSVPGPTIPRYKLSQKRMSFCRENEQRIRMAPRLKEEFHNVMSQFWYNRKPVTFTMCFLSRTTLRNTVFHCQDLYGLEQGFSIQAHSLVPRVNFLHHQLKAN